MRDVVAMPMRGLGIDADQRPGPLRRVQRPQRGAALSAGLGLVRRRDGILQIDDHAIGAARQRLAETLGAVGGHEQT